MLGVGGGVLFVPGLVIFLSLSQHQAEATSLLAIIPVAIVGTYTAGPLRQRAPRATRCCSGCSRSPARPAASRSRTRCPARVLRDAFAVLMLIVAAQLVRRALATSPPSAIV